MGKCFAGLWLALIPLALHAQTPCGNTPAYSPCEISFELSEKDAAAHPQPYATVDLKVDFRSPRHRTLQMPGYWDGGRKMVVRFSPTEPGQWDYHVTSNVAEWNDKEASFTAAPSDAPGFIRPANLHHWAYTERDTPHLWMGVTELLFATLDDNAFRAVADARAAQKFNHFRGLLLSEAQRGAFTSSGLPDLTYFQRLDARLRYLNQKGMVADLVLAGGPDYLAKAFPTADQRRLLIRFLAARYAAFNITWQGVDRFEEYTDGRAFMREIGGLLKQYDPYQHPRTTGARITSSPLVDDGWMNFVVYGTADNNVGSIEHQVFGVPFVNMEMGREDSGAGKVGSNDVDANTLRRRLWNATMDGQYVSYTNTGSGAKYVDSPGAKFMTVWFDLMSSTRHWELEPYFDVDGGRAVALEDVEYLVYVEKPGPVELTVEKHGYDVIWINPINGETERRKFSGEHFTGEPPDKSHDWILHVVRESRLEGMAKSYKFTSREQELALQEIEANTAKVPFAIEQPTGDLSMSKPNAYSAKLTKPTRATRSMMWLWVGEVAADRQGYRVLATGQKGNFQPPPGIARDFPALMHLRLYGMNANGKVYELDTALQIQP